MANNRPQMVVLDGYTLNPGDLSWNKLKALGHLDIHDYTPPELVIERSKTAEILLPNKVIINRAVIEALPNLKCICVTATGYNNVDLAAAKERNIPVCNVKGYSTDSVAQHVFALLLEMTTQIGAHSQSVHQGNWSTSRDFSYQLQPLVELSGKTMGIYGFGTIGQRVADIALAFGMNVIATHKHPERDARPGVRFVSLEELFSESDVISLHAPLNDGNKGIVNLSLLSKMKSTAYLINTARGPLINESDLRKALDDSLFAGAGLDVLSQEPPPADHPLFGAKNCFISPHNAWASQEARARMMDLVVENVSAFLLGKPINVVN
jgi:glycerate dehydrogenase